MNIEKMINASLVEKTDRKRSGKFSPSLFGACYRRQIWNRVNEEKTNPIDERTLRVFKVGNIFHEFVQNIVVKQNPETKLEVMVSDDDILGFADMVMDNRVVEIKSQHSRAFWKMYKKNEEPEQGYIKRMMVERISHFLQGTYYAYSLAIEFISLVYISKDDLTILQIDFHIDEMLPKLIDELVTLRKWWEIKALPPAKPRLYLDKEGNSKECKYCAWYAKCKELECKAT